MTDTIIRIGTGHMVEIEEYNLVVEFNMDRIIEVDQGMGKAIGMILGEEILEAMQEYIKIKISEDIMIEVDIEETIEMIIIKKAGVGLEKGHIQVISEEMTGIVVKVAWGWDHDQVLIETELGVISVENMIILHKIVQQQLEKKDRQNKDNRCLIR